MTSARPNLQFKMRTAINAAIIDSGKILLVKKRDVWILPGGKPKEGESDLECLCREVGEELSGTRIQKMNHYKDFEGLTPHAGDKLKARVYFAETIGGVNPYSAEITSSEWVGKENKGYALSEITLKIFASLVNEGYIY